MSGFSVGIDVGGTFTDLIAVAEDGRIEARKVLSTPGDQSDGVRDALRASGVPEPSGSQAPSFQMLTFPTGSSRSAQASRATTTPCAAGSRRARPPRGSG